MKWKKKKSLAFVIFLTCCWSDVFFFGGCRKKKFLFTVFSASVNCFNEKHPFFVFFFISVKMSSPTTHHPPLQATLDAERFYNTNLRKLLASLKEERQNFLMSWKDGWETLLFHIQDVARNIDVSDERIIFYVSQLNYMKNK